MTPEDERQAALAKAQRVATYGPDPAPPVGVETAPAAPANTDEEAAAELFSAADLAAYIAPAERYVMPGGKALWVHPLSLDEVVWVNAQALKAVRRTPPADDGEAQLQTQAWVQVFQVVACCRKGADAAAGTVFGPEDAEKLRRNRGWWESIQQIAALSDRLGSESVPLDGILAGFFGAMESWLTTCSSPSNTGSPGISPEVAGACGQFVSSIRRRGKLLRTDAETLRELTGTE